MGSQVALEEWLYLHSNSWIIARSRQVLDHFTRAGAKGVEIAGDALNDVTWLALGKRPSESGPGPLTKKLRIQAGANVALAGGSAALNLFAPWIGIPVTIAAFLMKPYVRPRSNPPPQ